MNGDAPKACVSDPALSWAHVKHFTYVVLSDPDPQPGKLVWSLFSFHMWTGL